MYALSKLNKQHEQTWVNLQKRLNEVQFSYRKLFPKPEVYEFIKNKAVSVGSCEGYFVPSLLTTTAFLLACNNARVQALTHDQPLTSIPYLWDILEQVRLMRTILFYSLWTFSRNCYRRSG